MAFVEPPKKGYGGLMTNVLGAPPEVVQPLSNKQLDVYLKNVAGQLIKVEDVLDYKIDNVAFTATYRETTHGKDGKIVTLKKMWFNVSLLLSVTEEWK
jgi:hypothetical protein